MFEVALLSQCVLQVVKGNAQFPFEFQTTFIDAHNELLQGTMVMRKMIKDIMI